MPVQTTKEVDSGLVASQREQEWVGASQGLKESERGSWSRPIVMVHAKSLIVATSLRPYYTLWPARLLCPWDSPESLLE